MCDGKTLKSLRKLKNISQQEMACKLEISQQAYSKLEKQRTVAHEKLEKILFLMNSSRKELDTLKKFLPPSPE